jgi:hypothetical protein
MDLMGVALDGKGEPDIVFGNRLGAACKKQQGEGADEDRKGQRDDHEPLYGKGLIRPGACDCRDRRSRFH